MVDVADPADGPEKPRAATHPRGRDAPYVTSRVAKFELGLLVVAAAALIAFGWLVAKPIEDLEGCANVVRFELAVPEGTGGSLPELPQLASCADADTLGDRLRDSTALDFGFIAAYGAVLAWCCARASGWTPHQGRLWFADTRIDTTEMGRMTARVGLICVPVVALLDAIENIGLLISAGDLESPSDAVVHMTAGAAIAKFLVLALPLVVFLDVLRRLALGAIGRSRATDLQGRVLVAKGPDRRWQVPFVVTAKDPGRDEPTKGSVMADRDTERETLKTAPGGLSPAEQKARRGLADGLVAAKDHRYGICLSGGGIRSATFALGALQEIEQLPATSPWSMGRAQFLTSVSGGSYLAAAYQFLSHDGAGSSPIPPVATPPPDAAGMGTGAPVEPTPLLPKAGKVEDHLRRNSTHLADGALEWLLAAGEVLFKALYGLAVLLLAVWSVGVLLGWTFRTMLHGLDDDLQPTLTVDLRIWLAILLTFLLFTSVRALAVGKEVQELSSSDESMSSRRRDSARQAMSYGVVLVVTVALVLPFATANLEAGVSAVSGWFVDDEAEGPDRDDVLTELSDVIQGATVAGAGAAEAVSALSDSDVDGRDAALLAALAAAEAASDQADRAVSELRARVAGDDRAADLVLSSEFDPEGCSPARDGATSDDAEPGDTSTETQSIAVLGCQAARVAERAASAARSLALAAVDAEGATAETARATEAATDAADGAVDAADAVLRLGDELDGTAADGTGTTDGPVAWAALSALATAIGGFMAKSRLDVASRPTASPADTKKRKATDVAKKLGFGGTSEVIAGVLTFTVLAIAVSDVTADAWRRGPKGKLTLGPTLPAYVWWIASVVALAAAMLLVNANKTGLRNFYHRRLWIPYAVTPEGRTASWRTDTRLSQLGQPTKGRPELLICAAAQVSGRDHAPPGRRALSFVFSATACGEPDRVGYIATPALEAVLGRRYRQPVTLFGAMTTSGAAFGPAMGRQAKGGLGAVLAIANARLGAWLPNPSHLDKLAAVDGSLRVGSFQRWPRLTYWVREIIGQYGLDAPLVLTTDGGHFDNLGLFELLRRRCDRVLAFDASGAGATPTTLAEAIVLAREELGVEITLRPDPLLPDADPPGLLETPMGADPMRRSLGDAKSISDRLAKRPVLVADIYYPPIRDADDQEVVGATKGVLIYGTLALADADPGDWDVLEYAQRNDIFPNDGTDKQWFRSNTFSAYQQLGRRTAKRMLDVAAVVPAPA